MKRLILRWLKHKTGCKAKLRFTKTGSYYDPDYETIYFELDEDAPFFLEHLKEVHNYQGVYSNDIFGLLHEIGHWMNEFDNFTSKPLLPGKNEYYRYYNMQVEYFATEWAINWINDNLDLYNKLVRIFK